MKFQGKSQEPPSQINMKRTIRQINEKSFLDTISTLLQGSRPTETLITEKKADSSFNELF